MMRYPWRARTSLLAVGAIAAASALAACGSSRGGNSSTVTIWTSVDQPVVDGFNKVLVPEAKAKGITVRIKKVNNINQLIMTAIQAKNAPDIALIPQPGGVPQIVERNKATALDNIRDTSTLKTSMTPGTLE